MDQTAALAQTIYQSILEGSGDAVHLCDFDRYVPFFMFPHFVETFEGRIEIESPEMLHEIFKHIQEVLISLGGATMQRTCTVAQFTGKDLIRGFHKTELIDGSNSSREAYSGMCTLRLVRGQWLIAGSQFVEEKQAMPSRVLSHFPVGSASPASQRG